MLVYLVQHLCDDGSYEVAAITSTEEKAFEAIDAEYCRATGHKPGCKEGMCETRHGHNLWFEDVYQHQIEFETNDDFHDYERFGERRYAIAECEVDNPYWFRKEA